jgi:hypothetical protein
MCDDDLEAAKKVRGAICDGVQCQRSVAKSTDDAKCEHHVFYYAVHGDASYLYHVYPKYHTGDTPYYLRSLVCMNIPARVAHQIE